MAVVVSVRHSSLVWAMVLFGYGSSWAIVLLLEWLWLCLILWLLGLLGFSGRWASL
jgi:hypothetical protein